MMDSLFVPYDEWCNAINDLDDYWSEGVVPAGCTIVSKKSAALAVAVLSALAKGRAVAVLPSPPPEGETP